MERSRSGLFALRVASLALETPKVEPAGRYDPSEQLWRDDGRVVACDQGCMEECDKYYPTWYCVAVCC